MLAEKGLEVVSWFYVWSDNEQQLVAKPIAASEQSKALGRRARHKERAELPWCKTDAEVLVRVRPEGNIDRSS